MRRLAVNISLVAQAAKMALKRSAQRGAKPRPADKLVAVFFEIKVGS